MTQPKSIEEIRQEIGRRLKATRLALGLKTREVHRATGIGESTWSQYEGGRRTPDVLAMGRYCERFGFTLDWIYRGVVAGLPVHLAETTLAELANLPLEAVDKERKRRPRKTAATPPTGV